MRLNEQERICTRHSGFVTSIRVRRNLLARATLLKVPNLAGALETGGTSALSVSRIIIEKSPNRSIATNPLLARVRPSGVEISEQRQRDLARIWQGL